MKEKLDKKSNSKLLKGTVVSSKSDKTISVLVETKVPHKIYKKRINRSKKFAVHDENNQCSVGDLVEFRECAPISKSKTFVLSKVINSPN